MGHYLHRMAGGLQPLEEGDVVTVLQRLLGDDRRRQLVGVAHQEHLRAEAQRNLN